MEKAEVQTNIRLPKDLKQRLEKVAALNGRSLTAEVVLRLNGTFESLAAVMLENRYREISLASKLIEQLSASSDAARARGDSEEVARIDFDIELHLARMRMLEHDIEDLTKDLTNTPRRLAEPVPLSARKSPKSKRA